MAGRSAGSGLLIVIVWNRAQRICPLAVRQGLWPVSLALSVSLCQSVSQPLQPRIAIESGADLEWLRACGAIHTTALALPASIICSGHGACHNHDNGLGPTAEGGPDSEPLRRETDATTAQRHSAHLVSLLVGLVHGARWLADQNGCTCTHRLQISRSKPVNGPA